MPSYRSSSAEERIRKRLSEPHAVKASNHRRCRQAMTRHRITRRGIERSQRLGRH